MEDLLRPVTNRICSIPFCTSSSTTYCTIGFRATGSISLGWDLVAGSSRVPTPATGTIALLITSRLYLMEGKEKAKRRMDIHEQLLELRRKIASIDRKYASPAPVPATPHPPLRPHRYFVEELISGEVVSTADGEHFETEK